MKSLPVPEALLVFCLFVAAAFPLWHLTGSSAQEMSEPSRVVHPDEVGDIAVFLQLKFAHAPALCSLRDAAGQSVWESSNAEGMTVFEIPLPSVGEEDVFSLVVEWPPETPETAVQVLVEPDGLDTRTLHFWGTGTLEVPVPLFTSGGQDD